MSLPGTGDIFDTRYQVTDVLGQSGSSVMYAATDLGSGRKVVLKLLLPDAATADPIARARFMREVQVVAGLRDPHTLKLFAHGDSEGLLYVVFEYVPGQTLAELLQSVGRLDEGAVVHILTQLLAALREAHQAGILHRDLTPENVRVFTRGGDALTVKLMDFGIARSTDHGHPSLTKTGEIVGTPRYMSPEQRFGEPLTAASDIYGLGLVALELLVGSDAFPEHRVGDQPLAMPAGAASPPLMALLAQMTEYEPVRRPQSAAAVLSVLSNVHRGATASRPQFVPPGPSRGLDPLPWQKLGVALALIGATALAVALAWPREAVPPPAPERTYERPSPRLVVSEAPEPVLAPEPVIEGCDSTDPLSGDFMGETLFGLTRASWLIHVPDGYDATTRYPVVLLLHQNNESAQEFLDGSGFREVARENPMILVAPAGFEKNGRRERGIELVRAALEDVKERLCVDEQRLFAVGHGAGGYLAEHLSCLPEIAGIATNSYRENPHTVFCPDGGPTPHILLSPMKSDREPVDGGRACGGKSDAVLPLRDVEERWRIRNACSGEPKPVFRLGKSECVEWACDAPFVSCRLDGGHPWPGFAPRPFPNNTACDGEAPDFPSAARIWAFFSQIE